MIAMTPAFYYKVGSTADGKAIYRYFMANLDPHFYFIVYIVPRELDFDIFYIPKVNNTANFSIISLFDDLYGSQLGVPYGEAVSIIVANEKIAGVSDIVEITLTVPISPVVVNGVDTNYDIAEGIDLAKDAAITLEGIGLFTLANQLMITFESKIIMFESSAIAVSMEGVSRSIVQQFLLTREAFNSSLPPDMSEDRIDKLRLTFSTIVSTTPYTSDIAKMFSDVILLGDALYATGVDFTEIPYPVFFRLAYTWITTGGGVDELDALVTASSAVEIEVPVLINMATMEESETLYSLINGVQSFVYINAIEFKNLESGDTKTITFSYLDPVLLAKAKDQCLEVRSVQSFGKQIFFQYGYGAGCDIFTGMYLVADTQTFGIKKSEVMLEEGYTAVRSWDWGEDHLETYGDSIDSSNNIQVTIKGV